MNIDNLRDLFKRHKIILKDEKSSFNIVTFFVDENRKTSLVVERDFVFGENKSFEMDIKKMEILNCGEFEIVTPRIKIPKELNKLGKFNTINFHKVSPLKFSDDFGGLDEHLPIKIEELEERIVNILVFTVSNSNFTKKDILEMCSQGYTMFGIIPFAKEVFNNKKQEIYNKSFDGNVFLEKPFFPEYLLSLERFLSIVSAINTVNFNYENKKITNQGLFRCFDRSNGSEM